jgi:hypothetical protein
LKEWNKVNKPGLFFLCLVFFSILAGTLAYATGKLTHGFTIIYFGVEAALMFFSGLSLICIYLFTFTSNLPILILLNSNGFFLI